MQFLSSVGSALNNLEAASLVPDYKEKNIWTRKTLIKRFIFPMK